MRFLLMKSKPAKPQPSVEELQAEVARIAAEVLAKPEVPEVPVSAQISAMMDVLQQNSDDLVKDWELRCEKAAGFRVQYGVVPRDFKGVEDLRPNYGVEHYAKYIGILAGLWDEAVELEKAKGRLAEDQVPHWMLDDLLEIKRLADRRVQQCREWL